MGWLKPSHEWWPTSVPTGPSQNGWKVQDGGSNPHDLLDTGNGARLE